MADNVAGTPGSGATFRLFSDGTALWPGDVPAYVTGGSAGAWTIQYVQLTTGLPVQPQTGSTWAIALGSTLFRVAGQAPTGTPAALASNAPVQFVLVYADRNNTGVIYVGESNSITANAGQSTSGFPLLAGQSFKLPVSNANKIFLLGDSGGQNYVAIGT